jgi:hypothetical protein
MRIKEKIKAIHCERVGKDPLIAACAMAPTHQEAHQSLCNEQDRVLMMREVNKDSSSRIPEGASMKDFYAHSKSSQHGLTKGLIPVKCEHAKNYKKDKSKHYAHNLNVQQSLSHGYVEKTLTYTEEEKELLEIDELDEQGHFQETYADGVMRKFTFEQTESDSGETMYALQEVMPDSTAEPVQVLAKPTPKLKDDLVQINGMIEYYKTEGLPCEYPDEPMVAGREPPTVIS